MSESMPGVRFTDQAAMELSKLQGSEEYKAFLPYIAVSVHYSCTECSYNCTVLLAMAQHVVDKHVIATQPVSMPEALIGSVTSELPLNTTQYQGAQAPRTAALDIKLDSHKGNMASDAHSKPAVEIQKTESGAQKSSIRDNQVDSSRPTDWVVSTVNDTLVHAILPEENVQAVDVGQVSQEEETGKDKDEVNLNLAKPDITNPDCHSELCVDKKSDEDQILAKPQQVNSSQNRTCDLAFRVDVSSPRKTRRTRYGAPPAHLCNLPPPQDTRDTDLDTNLTDAKLPLNKRGGLRRQFSPEKPMSKHIATREKDVLEDQVVAETSKSAKRKPGRPPKRKKPAPSGSCQSQCDIIGKDADVVNSQTLGRNKQARQLKEEPSVTGHASSSESQAPEESSVSSPKRVKLDHVEGGADGEEDGLGGTENDAVGREAGQETKPATKLTRADKEDLKARTCPFCDMVLPDIKLVLSHYKVEHDYEPKAYKCDYARAEEEHIKLSSGRGNLRKTTSNVEMCYICGHQLLKENLLKHVILKHVWRRHVQRVQRAKATTCYICGKVLKHTQNMERHVAEHMGKAKPRHAKTLICDICGYTTPEATRLKNHYKAKHEGDMPFKCTQCAYKTWERSSLKCHMFRHQQEKQYKCSECPYQCIQKKQLRQHMSRHHGIELLKLYKRETSSDGKVTITRMEEDAAVAELTGGHAVSKICKEEDKPKESLSSNSKVHVEVCSEAPSNTVNVTEAALIHNPLTSHEKAAETKHSLEAQGYPSLQGGEVIVPLMIVGQGQSQQAPVESVSDMPLHAINEVLITTTTSPAEHTIHAPMPMMHNVPYSSVSSLSTPVPSTGGLHQQVWHYHIPQQVLPSASNYQASPNTGLVYNDISHHVPQHIHQSLPPQSQCDPTLQKTDSMTALMQLPTVVPPSGNIDQPGDCSTLEQDIAHSLIHINPMPSHQVIVQTSDYIH